MADFEKLKASADVWDRIKYWLYTIPGRASNRLWRNKRKRQVKR